MSAHDVVVERQAALAVLRVSGHRVGAVWYHGLGWWARLDSEKAPTPHASQDEAIAALTGRYQEARRHLRRAKKRRKR